MHARHLARPLSRQSCAPPSSAVFIVGAHFSARAERFHCSFGTSVVNGTRHNDSAISCLTPDFSALPISPSEVGAAQTITQLPLEVRARLLLLLALSADPGMRSFDAVHCRPVGLHALKTHAGFSA